MNYKVVMAYDGSRYNGWQKQGNTDKTIQGKLEQILFKMTGEEIEVHGSGRTDAGVHARGQVANFHIDWKKLEVQEKRELEKNAGNQAGQGCKREKCGGKKTPDQIMEYINEYLPEDIAVLSCEVAPERFHRRLSAVRKTYCYQLEMGPKKDVFQRNYYYGLGERLDVSAMKAAAGLLTGTHDFKSFCGNKKMKKSTVRTIEKIEFEQSGSRLHIYFTGNGFLHQMVRILTGTLIEVGQGKCAPDKITRILDAQDRQAAGPTAPAQGLFLVNVGYEDK